MMKPVGTRSRKPATATLAAVLMAAGINQARATVTWSFFETGISSLCSPFADVAAAYPGADIQDHAIKLSTQNSRDLISTYLPLSPVETSDAPSIDSAIKLISAAAWTGAGGDTLSKSTTLLAEPDLSERLTVTAEVSAHQADLTTSEIAESPGLLELSAKWSTAFFNHDLPLTAYAIGYVHAPPISSPRSIANSQYSLTVPPILALVGAGLASLVLVRRR
jgi:hypothetical protein